jgi:ribosomal protein S3AE
MGRNMEVSVSELQGKAGRDFYRILLAVERIDGKSVYTRFNGYNALKEHVTRVIRKRTQKIDSIMYIDTKDKWRLQISSMAILNRNTEISVRKKVRAHIEEKLRKIGEESGIDDLVKDIVSTDLQKSIKKSGTKIYPIRFFEITKIEVKSVPEKG